MNNFIIFLNDKGLISNLPLTAFADKNLNFEFDNSSFFARLTRTRVNFLNKNTREEFPLPTTFYLTIPQKGIILGVFVNSKFVLTKALNPLELFFAQRQYLDKTLITVNDYRQENDKFSFTILDII